VHIYLAMYELLYFAVVITNIEPNSSSAEPKEKNKTKMSWTVHDLTSSAFVCAKVKLTSCTHHSRSENLEAEKNRDLAVNPFQSNPIPDHTCMTVQRQLYLTTSSEDIFEPSPRNCSLLGSTQSELQRGRIAAQHSTANRCFRSSEAASRAV